jgi:NAD(P)-dependent dehydrogenase (short-subunit alcohol dehydrogenase family)
MSDPEAGTAWAMDGRTVLVTGAGGGLGRATAAALGARGAVVLVHVRDQQRAVGAAHELAVGGGRFIPVATDLGSLTGVRELAKQVRDAAPDGLHVLVNNAGAAFRWHELSPDGVERTMAVNHVAVAALTSMLLDSLRAGANVSGRPSRVVNLSSMMEKRGNPDQWDWSYAKGFGQVTAYANAKLVNLAYTYALARELAGSGVTINAANPGRVATSFGPNAGGAFRVIQTVGGLFMPGPDKGAATSVRLAADPSLDGATGGYYSAGEKDTSSAASRDPDYCQKVYDQTTDFLSRAPALSDGPPA